VTITFDADGSTHADLQPGPGELVQISDWDPAHDLAAVRLFNDDISDPNAIGTLRIGTGEVRRVAGGTSSPMFLGNEWLVWASSNRDVDAARIDGSDRHLLYHAEGEFGAFGQFFSFSTDNRWMYVSLSQVEADVWMMEWPEESTH
jgi:hypothetical protein